MFAIALAFLFCLSAGHLADSQPLPDTCPDDVIRNSRSYNRRSYTIDSPIQKYECSYTFRVSYAGIPFGTRTRIRRYYDCIDGYIRQRTSRNKYQCVSVLVPATSPTTTTDTATSSISTTATTSTMSPISSPMPPPPPSTSPASPTSPTTPPPASGLSPCPDNVNSYRENSYFFDILDILERRQCTIHLRSNGASISPTTVTIYVCPEGYKRVLSRRLYDCVRD